jgi:hypothetical protein
MRMSFFHTRDALQASYRYRGAIPAKALGVEMNDESADVWILAKITKAAPAFIERARSLKKRVIVDVCDAHLTLPHYQTAITRADAVTVPSSMLGALIYEDFGRFATVIDDPYEFEEVLPHVAGNRLLWFGHASNYSGLAMFREALKDYPLQIVSNLENCIPWSKETMREEFIKADIVLLPDSAPTKSANRAVEAIRQGCYVVATPHPSLEGIPGIWVGDFMKGVAWASSHQKEANERLIQSQAYVRARFSPARVANAWKTLAMACVSNWGAGISRGKDGSISTETVPSPMPIS